MKDRDYKKGNILVSLLVIVGLFFVGVAIFSTEKQDQDNLNPSLYLDVEQEAHSERYYKYNYRTGYSGNYGYSYDVEGYGDSGYVYGEVETSGKYGEGYIYDEEGNEVWVETEWTDYGVLEAYDEYGNWYELETY